MDVQDKQTSELIKDHTEKGKSYLNEAASTPGRGKGGFHLAIQEFVLAYKHALLLNTDRAAERSCLFNLGAAYIAAEYYARGIDVLKSILQMTKDQPLGSVPSKGDVLFNIGCAYDRMKEYDAAVTYYENALVEYRMHSTYRPMLSETLVNLGKVYATKQDYAQARGFYAEAANRYLEQSKYVLACYAMIYKVDTMIPDKGTVDAECVAVLEDCLENAMKITDSDMQSKLLNDLGLKYTLICQYDKALQCFDAALRLCANENKHQRALVLQNMGAIYNRINQYQKAIQTHDIAIRFHGELGNRNAQGQCFCNLAFAQSQLGQYEVARDSFLHALQAFKDSNDKNGQWQVHEGLAAVAIVHRRYQKAVYNYQQAIKLQAQSTDVNPSSQDRLIRKLSYALTLYSNYYAYYDDEAYPSRPTTTRSLDRRRSSSRRMMKAYSPRPSEEAINLQSSQTPPTMLDGPTEPQRPTSRNRKKMIKNEQLENPKLDAHNVTTVDSQLPDIAPTKPIVKNYNAGRRGYGRNEYRPMLHVARGLSSLTEASVTPDVYLPDDDIGDESWLGRPFASSDDSDDEDYHRAPRSIQYKGRVYSASPPRIRQVSRDISNVSSIGKKWRRPRSSRRVRSADPYGGVNLMQTYFEEPSTSKSFRQNSTTVSKEVLPNADNTPGISDKDRLNEDDEVDLPAHSTPKRKDGDETTQRSQLSETDYAGRYREQLKGVNDTDDHQSDFTSVSSSSLSSSSDNEDLSKTVLMVPASMPHGNAPSPPIKPPRTNRTYEPPMQGSDHQVASTSQDMPVYSQSTKKSLRFSPDSPTTFGESTHIYETLSPNNQTSPDKQEVTSTKSDQQNVYYEPPAELQAKNGNNGSSDSDVAPPLSSLNLTVPDGTQQETGSRSANEGDLESRRSVNDDLPLPPSSPPKKNSSKMCVVM